MNNNIQLQFNKIYIISYIIIIVFLLSGCKIDLTSNSGSTEDENNLIQKIELYTNMGEIEEAYNLTNKLIDKNPENPYAYCLKSNFYVIREDKNIEKAYKYINKSEEKIDDDTNPLHIFSIYGLKGNIYFIKAKYEGTHYFTNSKKYMKKAINVDNIDLENNILLQNTYDRLSVIYSSKGNNEKSLKYLKKLYEVNPTDYNLLYALAEDCFKLKKFNEGKKYLNELKKHGEGQEHLIHGCYANYYLNKGEYEKALDKIKKADEYLDTFLPGIYFLYVEYYMSAGNQEMAIKYLKRELENNIQRFYYYDTQRIIEELNMETKKYENKLEEKRKTRYWANVTACMPSQDWNI